MSSKNKSSPSSTRFSGATAGTIPTAAALEKKFAREIIELRETGLDHRQIALVIQDEYGIDLYPADILSFLEESVHVLESIRDVATLMKRTELDAEVRDNSEKPWVPGFETLTSFLTDVIGTMWKAVEVETWVAGRKSSLEEARVTVTEIIERVRRDGDTALRQASPATSNSMRSRYLMKNGSCI